MLALSTDNWFSGTVRYLIHLIATCYRSSETDRVSFQVVDLFLLLQLMCRRQALANSGNKADRLPDLASVFYLASLADQVRSGQAGEQAKAICCLYLIGLARCAFRRRPGGAPARWRPARGWPWRRQHVWRGRVSPHARPTLGAGATQWPLASSSGLEDPLMRSGRVIVIAPARANCLRQVRAKTAARLLAASAPGCSLAGLGGPSKTALSSRQRAISVISSPARWPISAA